MSAEDVVPEGLGDAEGLGEPSLAKRAARPSEAVGALEGFIEAEGVVLKLTEDFLSALRRARRASSPVGTGMGTGAGCYTPSVTD